MTSLVLAVHLCPTLCDHMDCSLLRPSFHEFFQARILEWVSGLLFPSSDDLPSPGTEPRSLASQADSLTSELWGSPYDLFESESHSVVSHFLQSHGLYSLWNSPGQNTGVGSHSLLQGIFPTHGSNLCLPHYRHILYRLGHQEAPVNFTDDVN